MNSVFEIASKVSTPLALSGVVAAIVFYIFRQILAKNFFPTLGRGASGAIIQNIINKLFYLAIFAFFLGFVAYVMTAVGGSRAGPDSVTVSLTSDMTFRDAAEMIAGNENHTMSFPDCTKDDLQAKLKGGTLTGRTSKELLETLQYRVVAGAHPLKYRVSHLVDRGVYEVQCSH